MRGEKRKPTNKSIHKEIGHKTQLYMERPKRGKKRKKKDTISSDRVEIITKKWKSAYVNQAQEIYKLESGK